MRIQKRFHNIFDLIVEHIQQRNEAINNDLIFSNLSFFVGKTSLMTSTNYPIDLKLPKWWMLWGWKLTKLWAIMDWRQKNSSFTSFWKSFVCQRSEFLTLFWEERPQTSDWKIVWSFPLFNFTILCQSNFEVDFNF